MLLRHESTFPPLMLKLQLVSNQSMRRTTMNSKKKESENTYLNNEANDVYITYSES